MSPDIPPGRFLPLKAPQRAATFVWEGRVCSIDLDTRCLNCPKCGMRMFLPHNLTTETEGGGLATVSPSVVCPPEHGGCGWHLVIQQGNAV